MRTPSAPELALRARLVAGELIPQVPLVYMGLTVPQRWAVGGRAVVWGGFTWEPLDIAIAELRDEVGQFNNLRLSLPAVTPAQRALAAADVEGAAVLVYKALVDPDTGVAAGAQQLFAGELDQPGWQDGPLAIAHFLAEHQGNLALRPRGSRYTNDEQRRRFPGDTSLDVDPRTDGKEILWPSAGYFRVREE